MLLFVGDHWPRGGKPGGKTKKPPEWVAFVLSEKSDGAGNLAGTQAASAHVDVLGGTIDDRLDATDVGLPGAVGTSVRVGDLNTEGHALAADITFSHSLHLLVP